MRLLLVERGLKGFCEAPFEEAPAEPIRADTSNLGAEAKARLMPRTTAIKQRIGSRKTAQTKEPRKLGPPYA